MGIEFRCERCGKLIRLEAGPPPRVRCPHCRRRVDVPAELVSLPRPRVPAETPPTAGAPETTAERPDAVGAVAGLMPWIISAFFHMGLLVILAFVTLVMLDRPTATGGEPFEPTLATLPDPGPVIAPPVPPPPGRETEFDTIPRGNWRGDRDSKIVADETGKTKDPIEVIGVTKAGPGRPGRWGVPDGDPDFFRIPVETTPRSGGGDCDVVYLVDCSGSMLDSMSMVKRELVRSIGRLDPRRHRFHVLFFSDGRPKENPARRLVSPLRAEKLEALKFLRGVQPMSTTGRTDPREGLRRAFQVLRRGRNLEGGKVIYLLTDGEFCDNEKVVQTVCKLNADRDVRIHTILYRFNSPAATKVLRRIAARSGGRMKFIAAE